MASTDNRTPASRGSRSLAKARAAFDGLRSHGGFWLKALSQPTIDLTLRTQAGQRTRIVSLALYVLMGWLALVAIGPLVHALPAAGTAWLVAGGVIYSAGIYFFINDERIRHGHGIWHLFVLAGSLCQFVSVVRYVA